MTKVMPKVMLVLVLVVVAACKKKEDKPAAPSPAPTEAKPATPEAKPEPPKPDGDCEIAVTIAGDKVTYKSGGEEGSMPKSHMDFAVLAPLKHCAANIKGDDQATYQDVIHVMDLLLKEGITNLSIGDEIKGPDKKPPQPKLDDVGIQGGWQPDGTLVGKIDPDAKQDMLKTAPVIVLTKTTATVSGKDIGSVDGADLAARITTAIGEPKESLAILQADASLSYAIIARAIEGAKKAGCDNVLFAVKNR